MPITVFSEQVGDLVQWVNTQTGAVATGTTIMPADDTIPQITEGDEYMTLAITPTSAANTLLIDVTIFAATSVAYQINAALFQDATAGALAAGTVYEGVGNMNAVRFIHKMTAGTTAATTFRVRIGPSGAATVTFNGSAAGRIFGGVFASSITIMEVRP